MWFSISEIILGARRAPDRRVALSASIGGYCVEAGRCTDICRNMMRSLFGPPRTGGEGRWRYEARLIHTERWTRPVVVYHCYGGSHTSVVSAALHLGWLPRSAPPCREDLEFVRAFDSLESRIGQIHHLGRDRRGVEVKAVGLGGARAVLWPLYLQLMEVAGWSREEIIGCHTLPAAGPVLRVGGFLSVRLGLTWPGRPLVIWGVRRAHPELVRYVEGVERRLDALPPSS
ncbi:MAG: DUF3189 family protein [Bacillota bacterium]